jgi:hypothetical protein
MESENLFLCQGFQISGPGMQIHGNPGDYAWGRGGLDAIITQVGRFIFPHRNLEDEKYGL